MIYLYAVTETPAEPPGCAGLEDEPVRVLSARELAGIYSDHDRGTFDPEPDALWRHDHVVEAAMARGAVLPARFGTTFADTAGLAAALVRDQSRLHHRLEQVRGCVELAVRLSLPGPGGSPPQDGRHYPRPTLAR